MISRTVVFLECDFALGPTVDLPQYDLSYYHPELDLGALKFQPSQHIVSFQRKQW